MSRIRKSARDINLNIHWQFSFLPPGSSVKHKTRDTLYLDVGNQLSIGIIDQHHTDSYAGSVAELVFTHPELIYEHLLGRWLDLVEQGQALPQEHTINIVTHHLPDFDGLVSIWLSKYLIETGGFPSFTKALVAYVNHVDQGDYKVSLNQPETATYPIHMAYLAIQNLPNPNDKDKNHHCLQLGIKLLEHFEQEIHKQGKPIYQYSDFLPRKKDPNDIHNKDLINEWVGSWRNRKDKLFEDAKSLLDQDHEAFEEDKLFGDVFNLDLPIMNSTNVHERIQVKTFILNRPPKSKLNKYWVRASGWPFFICPYDLTNNQRKNELNSKVSSLKTKYGKNEANIDNYYPRVVLSLDPNYQKMGKKPTLRGLGTALERLEVNRRIESGGDDRPSIPRWNDDSVNNGDPWYDGRGHRYTIIDTPSSATHLSYQEIQVLAQSCFWHIPITKSDIYIIHVYKKNRSTEEESDDANKAILDIMEWVEKTTDYPYQEAVVAAEETAPEKKSSDEDKAAENIKILFNMLNNGNRGQAKITTRIYDFPITPQISNLKLGIIEARLTINDEKKPHDLTLEKLVAWSKALPPKHYLFSSITLQDQGLEQSRTQILLNQLCLDGKQHPASEQHILFNDHVVTIKEETDKRASNYTEETKKEKERIREILRFIAYQSELMTQFTKQLSDVSKAEDYKSGRLARELLKDYIWFQTNYFQEDFTSSHSYHTLYLKLRSSLNLEARHSLLNEGINQLEFLEKERLDRDTQLLLFFVGLTSVVDTLMNNYGHATSGRWTIMFLVLLVIFYLYYRIQSYRLKELLIKIYTHSKVLLIRIKGYYQKLLALVHKSIE